MDELKYKDGKFTVNGIDVNSISATSAITEAVEIAQTVSANTSQFSVINDPEGRLEIKTDSEDKIISYRGKDSVLHEETGIATKSLTTDELNISDSALTKLEEDLKKDGFFNAIVDYSTDKYVEIPLPRTCAKINLIVDRMPATDGDVQDGYLEFFDKNGNYFKKPITKLDWQGDSSKVWAWKNYGFDFNDKSKIKFGNFVACDSFHLKKFFTDVFRGQVVVIYRLMDEVYHTRKNGIVYPFDYLYNNDDYRNGNGTFAKDFPTGAMTHPDGFPVRAYCNGEYLGIYAFLLKKDRANYNMDKKKHNQIFLDGTFDQSTMWGGTVDWTSFEVRNPKILTDMDGKDYDGDHPKEPSDDYLDTKESIMRLSSAITVVNLEQTVEDKRAKFEEYFNLPFIIDYFLMGQVISDTDGFRKNWLWCTWDGNLWSPCCYDKDLTLGNNDFSYSFGSETEVYGRSLGIPTGLLNQLYQTEIKARYKELRDLRIFDHVHISDKLKEWIDSVGYDNLKEDIEKICLEDDGRIATMSYRDNNLKDGWELFSAANRGYDNFDPTKDYKPGERCTFDTRYTIYASKNIPASDTPLAGEPYQYIPKYGGWHNSFVRVFNWLKYRINFLDGVYEYNN